MAAYTLPTRLPAEIFRAYDIRGVVPHKLNENIVYSVGLALGSLAREQQISTWVIGHDHRFSSVAFNRALCAGLLETSMHVIDVGQVPTPALYFATHFLKTFAGVMITGSHCAPEYNGLKMVMAGKPLAEEAIQALAVRIQQAQFQFGQGHYTKQDITSDYLQAILSRVTPLKNRKKVVLDAGHGMMSELAPLLLEKLNCEVVSLYCEIDPTFPDHHPDPSVPENLQDLIHLVQQEQAALGIAFDGDGDRIGVVTDQGTIIWPDRLLAAYAQALLPQVPGGVVLYDVKCTRQLKPFIEACGGKPVLWKTGHSHIKSKMQAMQAVVAGEMSGHLFFGHNWYGFDDALFAAAMLVSMLDKQPLSTEAFFAAIPNSLNTPELKLPMAEKEKFLFIEKFIQEAHFSESEKITIDGLRVEYADGFGLIRASNTSPYLILRFEGDTPAALSRIQEEFKKNLLAIAPTLPLPF